MPRIFISYRREDSPANARLLHERLSAKIGPRWLNAADAAGRRLDNPPDNVRWEVCESLRRGKRVIPVLVDQVGLPSAGDLPEPLRPLAEKNLFALSHLSF